MSLFRMGFRSPLHRCPTPFHSEHDPALPPHPTPCSPTDTQHLPMIPLRGTCSLSLKRRITSLLDHVDKCITTSTVTAKIVCWELPVLTVPSGFYLLQHHSKANIEPPFTPLSNSHFLDSMSS